MQITSYYPVLMVEDVAATSAFYRAHFDFEPAFDAGWYVHLQSKLQESVNLAILAGDHETIPAKARGSARGLLINFEVQDVDQVYARLCVRPGCRSCFRFATSPSVSGTSSPKIPTAC